MTCATSCRTRLSRRLLAEELAERLAELVRDRDRGFAAPPLAVARRAAERDLARPRPLPSAHESSAWPTADSPPVPTAAPMLAMTFAEPATSTATCGALNGPVKRTRSEKPAKSIEMPLLHLGRNMKSSVSLRKSSVPEADTPSLLVSIAIDAVDARDAVGERQAHDRAHELGRRIARAKRIDRVVELVPGRGEACELGVDAASPGPLTQRTLPRRACSPTRAASCRAWRGWPTRSVLPPFTSRGWPAAARMRAERQALAVEAHRDRRWSPGWRRIDRDAARERAAEQRRREARARRGGRRRARTASRRLSYSRPSASVSFADRELASRVDPAQRREAHRRVGKHVRARGLRRRWRRRGRQRDRNRQCVKASDRRREIEDELRPRAARVDREACRVTALAPSASLRSSNA